MKYFKIGYGCGCGDNEDYIIAIDLDDANHTAYESAIEDYESFEGLHGIRGMEDIAIEDYDLSDPLVEFLLELKQDFFFPSMLHQLHG